MTHPTPSARGPSASPLPRGQGLGVGGQPDTRLHRLQSHWVYGALPLALVLLALTPVLTQGWTFSDRLTWLTLPAYMLHQYEEHDADRFRLFANDLMGGLALSLADVFWINVVGVWVVLAGVIWATLSIDPGWGTIAGWFLLINGIGHLAQAAILRRENPGVRTAALAFLPLGLVILIVQTASLMQSALALGLVLALHAAIVLRARQNLRNAG